MPEPGAASLSSPPQVTRGTRSRAGNAMARTRQALLDAAAVCLTRTPAPRLTMVEVAVAAGVAKGTLYNHFRTREELYRSLCTRELDAVLAAFTRTASTAGPVAALVALATAVGEHPVLRALARLAPAALVEVLAGAGDLEWDRARAVLAEALGEDRAEVALRWVVSLALRPAPEGLRRRGAAWIAAGAPEAARLEGP